MSKKHHNTGRLVLTRKVGQSVQIGPDILVTMTPHGLAIEAPRDRKILRSELAELDAPPKAAAAATAEPEPCAARRHTGACTR
jgi:sRNA-binding carbon storage regulator CsrA